VTLSPLRGLSRRGLLTAAAGSALGLAGCSSAVAQRDASVDRVAYGQDPSQFGDLYLPGRIPLATVVVIHGGYWVDGFVAEAMQPMCRTLQADGYAVWNLEYRRIGGGGGWPATFEDVATGIDHLTTFDTVDTSDVRLVGHSAGGTLAVWAASRRVVDGSVTVGSLWVFVTYMQAIYQLMNQIMFVFGPFQDAVRPVIPSDRLPPWTVPVWEDSVPLPNTPQPVVPLSASPLASRFPPPPPEPVNCHQLTLNSVPLPPAKRRYRSCVPVAPLTGQVTVVQVCQPPVPGTVQVPTTVPPVPSSRSSMRPPDVAEATRAVNEVAPAPKATPFTLM